jgi:hypothetical protein
MTARPPRQSPPAQDSILACPMYSIRPPTELAAKRVEIARERFMCFKRPAHLAVPLPALHMTLSQAGPSWEHDAMATVLIIGAS